MIIDTHLHLIYQNRIRYPWLDEVPALRRDAVYADYATLARRIGISGALHMEVDVHEEHIEAETEMVSELMSQSGSLMKGAISSCRPESSDFEVFLERQILNSCVKGLRRVLHVVPDEVSTTSVFRNNVKRLSETRLTFDLCVLPAQLPLAMQLADYCPDVIFVLDHCGVPDVKAQAFDTWSKQVKALSERENVYAKISGVIAYGDSDKWTLEHIRPFVEHTVACFGWDRVLWGSDSPVCTLGGNIETWVAATHALLAECAADEKQRLLCQNATRLWSLAV